MKIKDLIAGDEVVQLYLRDVEADVTRPIEQLFGFKRISLKPSERVQVIFTLPMNALGFYNQAMEYIVEPGDILIYFGSVHPNFGNSRLFVMDYFNPRDVKIQGKFTISGKKRILAHSEKTFFSDVEVIPISS